MELDLNVTVLAGVVGALLSLALSYIPGWREQYAGASSEKKSAIMAGLLVLVVALIAGSSCLNWWVFITCDKIGIMQLAQLLFVALTSNQAVYKLSPQVTSVTVAKAER